MFEELLNPAIQPWIIALVQSMFVGMGGSVMKKLVLRDKSNYDETTNTWKGAKGVFVVTLPLQAVAVGALLGMVLHKLGLPIHPAFGTELGGAVVHGAAAGMMSVFGYDAFVDRIQYWIRMRSEQAEGSK